MKKIILLAIIFLSTTFATQARVPRYDEDAYFAIYSYWDLNTGVSGHEIIFTKTLSECNAQLNSAVSSPNMTVFVIRSCQR